MNKNLLSKILIFFLSCIIFPLWAQAPKVKYFVKFRDKNGTPYSLSAPEQYLNAKSIERRNYYHIAMHESDLPVTPAYFSGVEAIPNVKVLYALKWLNGVVISLDSIDLASAALSQINNLPYVSGSAKVRRPAPSKLHHTRDTIFTQYLGRENGPTSPNGLSGFNYGGSDLQNRQLNLPCLHDKGFRGQGMTIAVLDAGFGFVDTNPVFDSLRFQGRLLGTRNFVNGGEFVYTGSTHGTAVLSCMAANYPGTILGSAPLANYWLMSTEEGPGETISEEYNWVRGAEFADSAGVDILTTSLGYNTFDDASTNHTYNSLNGRTAPMSIAGTMAARKGMFVLNSAGNERASAWHYINVPADADSICSVGAVDGAGLDAAFSSVGPTSDGRIKPDLMARGAGTWVSQDTENCFPGNGTSFSAPVLAGAVACYWQANKQFNNMKILRLLKSSASRANAPNNNSGWGIPNLCPNSSFDFTAYCDPSTEILSIELSEAVYQSINIQIVDLLGNILYAAEEDASNLTFNIDASILADYVYLVTVKTSNGTKSKKFLKR